MKNTHNNGILKEKTTEKQQRGQGGIEMPRAKNPNSIKNLKSGHEGHQLSREDKSKGGKKSQEVQHRKKEIKECLKYLLETEIELNGEKQTGAEAITAVLFKKALQGDRDSLRAFELIRDSAGQKPSEKVEVSTGDVNIQKEIEEMIGKIIE